MRRAGLSRSASIGGFRSPVAVERPAHEASEPQPPARVTERFFVVIFSRTRKGVKQDGRLVIAKNGEFTLFEETHARIQAHGYFDDKSIFTRLRAVETSVDENLLPPLLSTDDVQCVTELSLAAEGKWHCELIEEISAAQHNTFKQLASGEVSATPKVGAVLGRSKSTTVGEVVGVQQATSVGVRLMMAMGWQQGHGLGKDGTGCTSPPRVEFRSPHSAAGLGFREPVNVKADTTVGSGEDDEHTHGGGERRKRKKQGGRAKRQRTRECE